MKKFILLFISLFVFVGCGIGGEKTEDPLMNGEKVEKVETSADAILDEQIFSQATSSLNIDECEKIMNKDKNAECKDVVNSLLITNEAVENSDISVCSRIPLSRYIENCETLVSEKIERENAKQNILDQREENQRLGQEAIDKEDVSICEQIDDENQRLSCRFNVLGNQAREQNNPTICEQIGEISMQRICEEGVNL